MYYSFIPQAKPGGEGCLLKYIGNWNQASKEITGNK